MTRPHGSEDVWDDFDPADLVAAANKRRATEDTAAADSAAPAPPKPRRRRPKIDPNKRVPFNAKVPRWVRSLARSVADAEGMHIQDLHAEALVQYAEAKGYPVDDYRPEPPAEEQKKAG